MARAVRILTLDGMRLVFVINVCHADPMFFGFNRVTAGLGWPERFDIQVGRGGIKRSVP